MTKSRNIFLLFLLFLLLLGCEKKVERVDEDRFAFGTFFKVTIFSDNTKEAKSKIELAFKEIQRIDERYNSKVKGSLVDNLNNTKKEKFDAEGLYLLKEVKKTYELSEKKYDITMEPLMMIWGFSEEVEPRISLPTEEELRKASENVDFSKVEIENENVMIKNKDVRLDTGSFLKGYAVKKAGEKLRESGVENGFISAISSIEAIGTKGDGSPWKIGIQNPDNPSEILGIIELNNQSMGVSGNYQTYVEIDGKKYHHILDKETNYPVQDKKMVVVVNKDSFEADMFSTAFFLMPIEKVLERANIMPDLDVLIVDKNDEIIVSKNLKFTKKNK
ncbi:MAG: FAD:protein FMN transferase [Cetobacterium sp.]|uniref:FAD:protein FMN transferase n=1 Tax=Cetobacterium sp. TaxID=2071632 RepID=UPI003F2B9AD4